MMSELLTWKNLRVPKKSSTFAPEIRGNTLKA